MDKIVIVSSQPEPDYSLLALIDMLLPECEIQIVLRKREPFEQREAYSSSDLYWVYWADTAGRV